MSDVQTQAGDALRRLALNEQAKLRVLQDPTLWGIFRRIADRYVTGEHVDMALAAAERANFAGHSATIDYMGESARRPTVARHATQEFTRLAEAIVHRGLDCSVSLDLSHIGSQIDRQLCRRNARLVADATARAGIELMLSMEGHDRVDQILEDHAWLSERFAHVGVTVQARLYRTDGDLKELLERPGRIRLVKGSFDTPPNLAHRRDAPELASRFDALAGELLRSGHPCSIATHDWDRLETAHQVIETEGLRAHPYVFEFLAGIGDEQRDTMRDRDHPTQEYYVYGGEWFLYVCNRLAEDPTRIFQAVVDALGA